MSTDALRDHVDGLRLIDHHVHGVLAESVDRARFETFITESDRPIPAFMTQLDSQLGFAIRRHCAPVLGLASRCSAADYFARRAELGEDAVNRALLQAAGVDDFLIDTGYEADAVLDVPGMAQVSGARTHHLVRIESVLEAIARDNTPPDEFATRLRERLAEASRTAVGLKSIVAYRHGFRFDPSRPTDAEVRDAAAQWRRELDAGAPVRVTSEPLLRFGLWEGVAIGLPLQLHVGYGDPDVQLDRCNPVLLTHWIKAVEPLSPAIMLLHCYPYHREAGYLAQVFPHVHFDVGLALNYVGARGDALLAESLELAPFAKTLYSSDAWGPAELHYLGAALWRRAMTRVLGRWVDEGEWALEDAIRVADMIGRGNAERVYGLADR